MCKKVKHTCVENCHFWIISSIGNTFIFFLTALTKASCRWEFFLRWNHLSLLSMIMKVLVRNIKLGILNSVQARRHHPINITQTEDLDRCRLPLVSLKLTHIARRTVSSALSRVLVTITACTALSSIGTSISRSKPSNNSCIYAHFIIPKHPLIKQ